MSPEHAVQLWWQYMEPKKNQGYRLVSPATTNSPAGLEWQKQFFAQCSGCTVRSFKANNYTHELTIIVTDSRRWYSRLLYRPSNYYRCR